MGGGGPAVAPFPQPPHMQQPPHAPGPWGQQFKKQQQQKEKKKPKLKNVQIEREPGGVMGTGVGGTLGTSAP